MANHCTFIYLFGFIFFNLFQIICTFQFYIICFVKYGYKRAIVNQKYNRIILLFIKLKSKLQLELISIWMIN